MLQIQPSDRAIDAFCLISRAIATSHLLLELASPWPCVKDDAWLFAWVRFAQSRNDQVKICKCTESDSRASLAHLSSSLIPYSICRGQIVWLEALLVACSCSAIPSIWIMSCLISCTDWRLSCHNKMYNPLQVFEYCTTDLKKFMDRTGKGPTNPLPASLVKVFAFPCCFWLNIVVTPDPPHISVGMSFNIVTVP